MQPTPVARLIEGVAAGDQDAWAELVDRYERLIWSVARGFRFNDATTADVVQTVWLRFAEHCHRIRNPDRITSWLATTCRNECVNVTRRARREVADDEIAATNDKHHSRLAAGVDERLLDDEAEVAAVAAFARLSEPCQQLLRLLCTDPAPSYQTISEITGRPVGSIGPTRQRCLQTLRTTMEVSHG